MREQFKVWAEQLGRSFSPHCLRHCFAVHLLRKGADIRVVQLLLGHEDIDTTRLYLRLVKEDYKRAYDKAFPAITVRV